MKILVSGSRNWVGQAVIWEKLRVFPAGTILIHGDARGVDKIAGWVGKQLGFKIRKYPALAKGRQWPWAGPARNQDMMDSEHSDLDGLYIDQAFLFHEDLGLGKGTRDMYTRLQKADPAILIDVTIDRGNR